MDVEGVRPEAGQVAELRRIKEEVLKAQWTPLDVNDPGPGGTHGRRSDPARRHPPAPGAVLRFDTSREEVEALGDGAVRVEYRDGVAAFIESLAATVLHPAVDSFCLRGDATRRSAAIA
jgi:hypothetical protein